MNIPLILLAIELSAFSAPRPLAPPYGLPSLTRADFNRLAGAAGIPLFWRDDTEGVGDIAPAELAVLDASPKMTAAYVTKGAFTKTFEKAYRDLVESRRREAVRAELAQGRSTLVETDLTQASDEDRALVAHFLRISAILDTLYTFQNGAAGLDRTIPKDDAASRALFARNHGPWCEAAKTESDPFCNATPTFARRQAQSYPPAAKVDDAFCKQLAVEPNTKELMDPFAVVRDGKKGGFVAVPYTKVYGKFMGAIAKELKAAAKTAASPEEAPLRTYLTAAALGFQTNVWEPVDEAWSAMSGSTSKWYVRIGPDETYWDPCGLKAGFHLSFARLDPAAEALKKTLTGLRTDMEKRLETLAGADFYSAREVAFNLPDFILIVLNAGDSRGALGGTIGQSLPNFGKVAEESRGRTVVMANLNTDPDSMASQREKDAALLAPRTLVYRDDTGKAGQMTTVLHEATHNLGPTGSTRIDGKKPEEIFGGDLDAVLEELKAETGSLFYLPMLKDAGVLTDDQVGEAYFAAISWGFGHVAQGMFASDGRPKTYSHVAAIQMKAFMEAGAITWQADALAGTPDVGRFDIDMSKMPGAVEALMKEVVRIKAKGDKAGGEALDQAAVTEAALEAMHAKDITDRILRAPKASFAYGIRWPE